MSLRYLAENNDYTILYGLDFEYRNDPRILAFLEDKNTGQLNMSREKLIDGNLEKCLMTLGKRLIKIWQNRKK